MKRLILSAVIAALLCCTIAHGQNDGVRAVVLKQTVELTPKVENEAADFQIISVTLGGKLVRQFAAGRDGPLNIVATFNGCVAGNILRRKETHPGFLLGGDSEEAPDELRLPYRVSAPNLLT